MTEGERVLPNRLEGVPPALRHALTGPGGPFELTTEPVRGIAMTAFARRPQHLPASLLAAADRHPDRPYLIGPDRTVTYGEAARTAAALAGRLRDDYGVRPGDRVALVGANSVEHALTVWAVLWTGGVVVGLNGWWTGTELRQGLALTEPVLLVGDEQRMARLAGPADRLLLAVTFADLHAGLAPQEPADPPVADADPPVDRDEDDPAAILFTSGTTGQARGVVISHRAVLNFSQDAQLRGALAAATSGRPQTTPRPTPVTILASPLFHVSGLGPLVGTSPISGMTLVLPPPGRFDPAVHLDLTQRHGVTSWSGVPTQLLRLLRHPGRSRYDLGTLQGVGFGGAPLSAELAALFAQVLPGVSVTNGYGMTETFGIGTAITRFGPVDDPAAVGAATPTAQVVVRGVDGTEIDGSDPTAVGEICIRCPSGFLGYWRDGAATAAAVDADGWYRTGDFGRIAGGMLHLESRMRDLIIRGGENVYPIEIENRLSEHPDLLDAAVIGVPHPELGQEVTAVVVARDGADLTAADVTAWAAATLAAFKVPTRVRFVAELPYSATGKLLKRELEADPAVEAVW